MQPAKLGGAMPEARCKKIPQFAGFFLPGPASIASNLARN
jgi:hypothetical protein